DNAAENTIHLNHRQFHHGLWSGRPSKARIGRASKQMGFFQNVAGLIRLEACSDSVTKADPSRMFRLTQK
ncbi:hypothetical protein, partial [Pseudomonas sp.]|uniref:hypothetical protein n=1 Tax=Pseudomonas sp. TaxID=306 RepID=UPI003FD6ED09